MSDTNTSDLNPFEGMYVPDEDGPVAPPMPSGMPVRPTTGGMPVRPGSPEAPAMPPVAPVAPVGAVPPPTPVPAAAPTAPAVGGMPVPPAAAEAAPDPTAVPVSVPAPVAIPTPVPVPAPVPVPVPAASPQPSSVPTPVPSATPGRHKEAGPVLPSAASTPGVTTVEDKDADDKITLDDLLVYMVEAGGSDLHLSAGSPPVIRVRGEMKVVAGYGPLTPKQLQDTMYSVMNSKQRMRYEENLELDFAYTVPGQARFRVNVFKQRGAVGAVMRTIPWEILSLDALNLPEILGDFANLPRGLVLVTGPTGSGKSTTLAAIIDKANRTRSGHIITIEDPVEFLHQHRGCVVNQREVGEDTHSFANALRSVLRQDPDIILVGEMRDLETISVALSAAETGHLVFGTLHTQSAQETITRIIDVFPPEQQQQVQTQLAASLQGVVCQQLTKTADGNGRQAAVEIMIATPNVRALIREKKLQQVQGALQSGGKYGMQTLNQDLANHVLSGRITYETGLDKASDKEDFDTLVGGREAAMAVQRKIAAAKEQQQSHGMMGGYAPPVQ